MFTSLVPNSGTSAWCLVLWSFVYMDVFLPMCACTCCLACLWVFFSFLFFSLYLFRFQLSNMSNVISVTADNSCISICWNDPQGSFWCDTWMEWVLKNSLGKSFQPCNFSGLLINFQILIILAPSLLGNSFLLIVRFCLSGSLFYFSWVKLRICLCLFYLAILCSDICIILWSAQAFLISGLVVSGKLK